MIGSIQLVGFSWSPEGFVSCNGQLLDISQNQALYSLIGVTWGGDGRTVFAVPDYRGRAPVGFSYDRPPGLFGYYDLGTAGGAETRTLTIDQLPRHNHAVITSTTPTATATTTWSNASITSLARASASTTNDTYQPVGTYPGTPTGTNIYANTKNTSMAADFVTVTTTLNSLDIETTIDVDLGNLSTEDTGTGEEISIMQPWATGNYVIATDGFYPSRK